MLTRTDTLPARDQLTLGIKRWRDPRLDFFRGLALYLILVSHIPYDEWALWLPARFGFSDATEIFVFLSGMASAMAFGRLFDREGPLVLALRIAHRIWQIYWAHIGLFIATATLMAVLGTRPDGVTYVNSLNLDRFFEEPAVLLPHLLTLTYVPNFFDVLPLYMVLLAMLPLMLLAERAHRLLPFGIVGGLWLLAQTQTVQLSAEPWTTRPWFFDPLGWQLVFFTGFFIGRGNLKPPAVDRRLALLAAGFLLVSIPISWYWLIERQSVIHTMALELLPLTEKSRFGLLRFLHFMALAYLAAHLVGSRGERLQGRLAGVVRKVGSQSLAVFVSSMFLAQVLGFMLDHTDRSVLPTLLVNLTGFAALTAIAYGTAWFKSAPWR